ncbi:MAG TPA: DUF4136 domain-containing protein [Thermodesulfovibrionales bacterium]|nr:DUF4136 domain-containing protein [Thermodesulfovibrionales bacterium]
MKRFLFYILFVAIAGGCSTLDVNYDFDRDVNFASIKTYDWMSVPQKTRENELTLKHIKSSVNRQLQAKGLIMTSHNPDVLIALHGGKERKVDVQEWGYAYRDRDYYHAGPFSGRRFAPLDAYGRDNIEYRRGTDTYEYEIGTIIIDFVDSAKKELIWRGVASGVVNPDASAEEIDRTIAKILENYPPGAKK